MNPNAVSDFVFESPARATIPSHASFFALLDHPIDAIRDVLGRTPGPVSVVRKFGLEPYERII
jgi:hypothetical protein